MNRILYCMLAGTACILLPIGLGCLMAAVRDRKNVFPPGLLLCVALALIALCGYLLAF